MTTTPQLDDLGTEHDKPFCLSICIPFWDAVGSFGKCVEKCQKHDLLDFPDLFPIFGGTKHCHIMSSWWLSYALKYGLMLILLDSRMMQKLDILNRSQWIIMVDLRTYPVFSFFRHRSYTYCIISPRTTLYIEQGIYPHTHVFSYFLQMFLEHNANIIQYMPMNNSKFRSNKCSEPVSIH